MYFRKDDLVVFVGYSGDVKFYSEVGEPLNGEVGTVAAVPGDAGGLYDVAFVGDDFGTEALLFASEMIAAPEGASPGDVLAPVQ